MSIESAKFWPLGSNRKDDILMEVEADVSARVAEFCAKASDDLVRADAARQSETVKAEQFEFVSPGQIKKAWENFMSYRFKR